MKTRGWGITMIASFFQGEYTRARSLVEESLVLSRKMGNQRGIATGLWGLGLLDFVQGNAVTARSFLEESLAICRKIGDQSIMPYYLENLAVVVVTQGQRTSRQEERRSSNMLCWRA